MDKNEIVLFESCDGVVSLPVPVESDTVWLTRMQMADLFGVTPWNITIHLRKGYVTGEPERSATSKDFLLVQNEGGRQITRSVNCYNLDAIISDGYRVNSTRATQFRIWATRVLKEYLLRGHAVNRERIRQLGQTVEWQQVNRRWTFPLFPQTQSASAVKGWPEAHRRPHACGTDGDDRRI